MRFPRKKKNKQKVWLMVCLQLSARGASREVCAYGGICKCCRVSPELQCGRETLKGRSLLHFWLVCLGLSSGLWSGPKLKTDTELKCLQGERKLPAPGPGKSDLDIVRTPHL